MFKDFYFNMIIFLVKLPKVDFDPATGNKLVIEEEKSGLNILNYPICSTFFIFEE